MLLYIYLIDFFSKPIQIPGSDNDEEEDIFKGSNDKNPVMSNVNIELV